MTGQRISGELTDDQLNDVSGGVLKEAFQAATRRIINSVTNPSPSILCNPDTALMNPDGSLTSDGPGCHRT